MMGARFTGNVITLYESRSEARVSQNGSTLWTDGWIRSSRDRVGDCDRDDAPRWTMSHDAVDFRSVPRQHQFHPRDGTTREQMYRSPVGSPVLGGGLLYTERKRKEEKKKSGNIKFRAIRAPSEVGH